MDKLLYDTIADDLVIQVEAGNRIFGANSVGIGPNKERPKFPWIAINELPSTPFAEVKETADTESYGFAIYVYDELGDGTRINRIMKAIRDRVKQLTGVTSSTGVRCTHAEWLGTSALIPDREYSANVKFCTIRLVANQ